MQNNLWKAVAFSVILTACGGSKQEVAVQEPAAAPQVKLSDQLIMSTLWVQRSAEAKYSSLQAYNLAQLKLQSNLENYRGDQPVAVILDLDETVLDNSPYEARLILNGMGYSPASWSEWVQEMQADAMPGAREFLRFAEAHGVEVFYISNRSHENLEPTLQNLIQLEMPFADPEHILLKREQESDKTYRRERVKERYKVLLLVGDQMSDFSEELSQQGMEDADRFGGVVNDSVQKFFVLLPNPMYGDFESSIYGDNREIDDAEKSRMRKQALNAGEESRSR